MDALDDQDFFLLKKMVEYLQENPATRVLGEERFGRTGPTSKRRHRRRKKRSS